MTEYKNNRPLGSAAFTVNAWSRSQRAWLRMLWTTGLALLLAFLVLPAHSAAQTSGQTSAGAATQQAGRVLIVVGKVTVIAPNGFVRTLKRRDKVYSGDTIDVSKRAFIQIRYEDKSLMSLRPGTRLTIETFVFSGKQDGSERSFYKLVKGGLRTISGFIGKKHKKNYRVATPVATLGIRGTHYAMRLCGAGECGGSAGQAAVPEGLYVEVRKGATAIRNQTGERVFSAGQGYFVRSLNASPRGQVGGFGFVFDKFEAQLSKAPPPRPDVPPAGEGEEADGGVPPADAPPRGEQRKDGDSNKAGPDASSSDSDRGAAARGGPRKAVVKKVAKKAVARALPPPRALPRREQVGEQRPPTQGIEPAPLQPANPPRGLAPPRLPQQNLGPQCNLSPVNQLIDSATVASNTRQLPNGATLQLSLLTSPTSAVAVGGTTALGSYEAIASTSGADIASIRQLIDSGATGGGEFRAAAGALVENGNEAGRIFWGRWGGGWEGKAGGSTSFNIGRGHAHYIYAEAASNVANLGNVSGTTATFYLDPALGTKPTNQNGVSGQLIHGAFDVDLGAQAITAYRLDLQVENREFNALLQSTTLVSSALTGGIDLSGTCQGCSSSVISGRSSIGFVDGAVPFAQAISGFYLEDANRIDRVNGTAVFNRNQTTQAATNTVGAVAIQLKDTGGASLFQEFALSAGGATVVETSNINGVGNVPVRLAAPTQTGTAEFNSSVARLVDTGGDAAGINWGRWDKDWRFSDAAGVRIPQGSAHFVYTDKVTSAAQLLATKSNLGPVVATFNRIGGTAPTDTQGSVGVVNQNSFNVNFGTLKVENYRLNATVAGRTYDVQQGAPVLVSDAQQGFNTTGTCTGCQAGGAVTALGRSNVTLVGDNASHAIGSYSVHDTGLIQGISGTSAFKR